MTGLTCPSAPASPGAVLLGVKGAEGRIVPLRTRMQVDADFLASAARLGPPEARMRFASPCQTRGCTQWTGSACGIIQRVLDHLGPAPAPPAPQAERLPPCTIRQDCRWFSEQGRPACAACDLVVTYQTDTAH